MCASIPTNDEGYKIFIVVTRSVLGLSDLKAILQKTISNPTNSSKIRGIIII